MTMERWLLALLLGWIVLLAGAYRLLSRSLARRRALARVAEMTGAGNESLPTAADERGRLGRWMFVAGYRDLRAPTVFVVATVAMLALDGLLAYLFSASGGADQLVRSVSAVSHNIADILTPLVVLAPWLAIIVLSCLPWLLVRRARRVRVEKIEQDLPITLELLATLSEAGLGFDSALSRVLDSQSAARPLTQELRGFQADVVASRPRVECFRRLARRVEVPSLSVFISAVVQAEQVGAGVASVLRRQADDLRSRRREDAMALAMTLPLKQVFPMVICFMPGIFVITLGPTLMEFLRYAEQYMGGR